MELPMLSVINLSPERPRIDAQALPELVDAYVADARSRVSAMTADSYDYLLSLLLEWWSAAGPGLDHVLDLRAWQHFERWLADRRSSQSGAALTLETRRKALSAAKALLGWAHRLGYLDRDFRGQIPAASGEGRRREAMTLEDLRQLLLAAGESRKPIRDQAMIAILIGTGIRRAELAGLDVEDIRFAAGRGGLIHIRQAKLGKSRSVAFDDVCGVYLLDLIEELKRSTGPLICGWNDERLTPKSVYTVVKECFKRAGLDSRGAGPHDLRRAFATIWTRQRRSLGDGQLLSMQLGHTAEAMTVRYSRPILDDLQESFVSPLSLL